MSANSLGESSVSALDDYIRHFDASTPQTSSWHDRCVAPSLPLLQWAVLLLFFVTFYS